MFRTKFKVIKVSAMRSGVKTNDGGKEEQWQARDVLLEEDNAEAFRAESAIITLFGEEANLVLAPGMKVEVTLFFTTHEYEGRTFNDVAYRKFEVVG